MKFFCADRSVETGVGAAGQFSRPLIKYLGRAGHQVYIGPFDPARARWADVVWTEWCDRDAFEAADSGLCKKLVVRVRGYEVWNDLSRMPWENVSALVYESPFIHQIMDERHPGKSVHGTVIPAGVDLDLFPFKRRRPGPVVALIGRAIEAKGYQLAVEWARMRSDLKLHLVLARADKNPRLVKYLRQSVGANVVLHKGDVDTPQFLDEIDANYLLSASTWETLGYTIAEAAAMGIKPLVHDNPGAVAWPLPWRWRIFDELNALAHPVFLKSAYDPGYNSEAFRKYVEVNLDAEKRSREFLDLVESLPELPPGRDRARLEALFDLAGSAINEGAPEADDLVAHFRKKTAPRGPLSEERAALATALADLNLQQTETLETAELWALRALADGPRAEPLCILGEVAAKRGDVEEAVNWYSMIHALPPESRLARLGPNELALASDVRWAELLILAGGPAFEPCVPPPRYHFIVPVWNAEKWIYSCVASILRQVRDRITVTVVDDASTVPVVPEITAPVRWIRNDSRAGALYSAVCGIDACGAGPEDVIAIVDGDDWLAHDRVIETLDRYYMTGAWATYGGYRTTDGSPAIARSYPKKVIEANAYRSHPYLAGGFKTYKAALFQKIRREDFMLGSAWIRVACDLAQMIPILELAGHRAMFVSEHVYTYNVGNPANLFNVAAEARMRVRDVIMARPPYERLTFLTPPAARS